MEVERSNGSRSRPRLEGSIVRICGSTGLSQVYVNTGNFITVDYMLFDDGEVEWYFYLDNEEIEWNELDDKLKLLVRTTGVQFWGAEMEKYSPGEYDDDRYYILEGLEVA